MLLGSRSIYNNLLFADETTSADPSFPKKKSRDQNLKRKQHELIIYRYYYYTKILDKNYPKTLELLEDEIYLSKRTLINIIMFDDNRLRLKNIYRQKPDVKALRQKYPNWVWN